MTRFKIRSWSILSLGVAAGWLLTGGCTPEELASLDGADERAAAAEDGASGRELPDKDRRRFAPGQVIVQFRGEVSAARQAAIMAVEGYQARELRPLAIGGAVWAIEPDHRVDFASIADEEDYILAAIEAVREHPDVEYAHENVYMEYYATPSDSLYPQQWHYPQAKFPGAWDATVGGVKIAVLDSGRLDHPDLQGRWAAGFNAVTGSSEVSDPKAAFDYGDYHHGIHVAGILGARTNNGTGVAGSCWNCSLMPVRVFDDYGQNTLDSTINGIYWAANNGARVINMSFGTKPGYVEPCSGFPALQTAINYAVNTKKVVVVAAAGNDNRNTAEVIPASCSGVIAVGATGKNGKRAPWSNWGQRVDVVAPGGDLNNLPDYASRFFGQVIGCPTDPTGLPASGTGGAVSTWAVSKPANQLSGNDYCYRYLAGTSMSAPHVAGLAGLILSQRPELTPAQVTARIKSTATPVFGCTSDYCGSGLINAAAAVYPPLPPRGMYYNPQRSGNGMGIYPRTGNNQIAFTWLTYTASEQPIWYRAELTPGAGAWEGNLLKSTWSGSSASTQTVGTAKLRFTNGQWRYEWTLGSAAGNEAIERLDFTSGSSVTKLTGLWQNNAQPGWFVEFGSWGATHVANPLVFNSSGQPTWLQGSVNSASTSLVFPLLYVRGKNLCPGCLGTPSTTYQPAGSMTVQGSAGSPGSINATISATFPGGSWNRPGVTLSRLTATP